MHKTPEGQVIIDSIVDIRPIATFLYVNARYVNARGDSEYDRVSCLTERDLPHTLSERDSAQVIAAIKFVARNRREFLGYSPAEAGEFAEALGEEPTGMYQ